VYIIVVHFISYPYLLFALFSVLNISRFHDYNMKHWVSTRPSSMTLSKNAKYDTRLDEIHLRSAENPGLCIEIGARMGVGGGTAVDRILAMAASHPDAPAIRGPMSKIDGKFSELCYSDFVESAQRVATEIKRATGFDGSKDKYALRDKFIGVYLKRDIEYVVVAFAVQLCGAAYVPMSDKLPDEQLAYILLDSKPVLVITTKNMELKRHHERVDFLYLEDVEGLVIKTTLSLKKSEFEGVTVEGDNGLSLPCPDNLAYMIYTSGTTGNPKGVEVEHHAMLNVLLNHVNSGIITKADLRKSVCVAAFNFDSHVREIWMPLVFGGCICIAEDVLHMAEGVMCAGTPSGLQAAAMARAIPAELKTIMVGGERLTSKVLQAITYPNTEVIKVINAYGPTETAIESLVWEADLLRDGCSRVPDRGVPIGLPVANAVAYGIKLDTKGERDPTVLKQLLSGTATLDLIAPRGVVCELYMGGEALARGYHNRPDLTRDKFTTDPFAGNGRMYQTGDLVIFSTQPGNPIEYVGRVDTQVKIRGKRVELEEVQSYLLKLDILIDCKVLLRSRTGQDHQVLVAYVVWRPQVLKKLSAAELTRQLLKYTRDSMEEFKRPDFVICFPEIINGVESQCLPLTISGKVDTKSLPDPWDLEDWMSPRPSPPLLTPQCESDVSVSFTAGILLELVQVMLAPSLGDANARALTVDADFFALGLTSLNVPTLKYEVKQRLGKDVGTEQIFLNPTASKLALFLSKPPEESGADLEVEELLDSSAVQDKPLPKLAVWVLTLCGAFLAHAMSICFMAFVVLLQIVYLHEVGKCWSYSAENNQSRYQQGYQSHCPDPSNWSAFLAVIASIPIVLPVTITSCLLMVAFVKWIIIGKYKPGVYSIDGPYYFRWLYVHYMEAFAREWLLVRLPFRSTAVFNCWLRLMGASIGKNVHLDTLDIHEMCCLTIEDGVTVQNDAMLSGHTFLSVRNLEAAGATTPVLVIGRCWIKKDSIVGPYAMVHPTLPRPGHLINEKTKAECATITEGVLPALQATSRLGQTVRMPGPMMNLNRHGGKVVRPEGEPTVWTPAVPGYIQFIGYLVMILFQWLAALPTLALLYVFLVPPEPGVVTWILRLWVLHTPWLMGIPYACILVIFKWVAIGRFRDGEQCTPYLDNMRWMLHVLLQCSIHRAFELASCSTEILNQFYRCMGMKIGWNAQVMPLKITEFDLFEIGDCVAFGGQVMVLGRDANGVMKKIRLGNDSAITNSACVMAGSQVGNHCLVGNLTLLPPGFSVPEMSKCVGTKYLNGVLQPPVVFSNTKEERPPRWQSNLVVFLHIVAAILWDLLEMPGMVLLAFILVQIQSLDPLHQGDMHIIFSSLGIGGAYLMANMFIFILDACTTTTLVLVKRMGWSFLGDYKRDSLIFVYFIYLTKLQMNQQPWNQVLSGTPWLSLIYRMWGADIAYSARIFMRFFADSDGLEIGAGAVLGYDCYLEQHQKTATKIEFHPLSIGSNSCIGQRSILQHSVKLGKGSQVYSLSSVPPNEPVDSAEVVGGILAVSYFKRKPEVTIRAAANEVRGRSFKGVAVGSADVADMVVVGAGAGGLVAAFEFMQQGLSVIVLEKTDSILGCWENVANETSHVAVSEATYRFPCMENESQQGDYPSRAEVLSRGKQFFMKVGLDLVTKFGAEVTAIKDLPGKTTRTATAGGQTGVFKTKHGHCVVNYSQGGITKVLNCKGVFIATGAQVEQNHHTFPGEKHFRGSVAYGSADDVREIVSSVKGKRVVIVGGGAFAIENTRTMLMHGAAHVTIVHRSGVQVWPRCIHYLLSTEKERKFTEYGEVYNRAAGWAGFSVGEGCDFDMAPFMHPSSKAQPTASDAFFAFAKMGLITLVRGEIKAMQEHSLIVHRHTSGPLSAANGIEMDCDVLLKCIGWKDPGRVLKALFPQFTQRDFIFLNKSPRIVFVCDPHYSYPSNDKSPSQETQRYYEALLETVPIGGTFSVLILARICAWLQIYQLGNPMDIFEKIMKTLPTSEHPTCSWGEQQFSFPTSKECSEMILYKIGLHKDLVAEKHQTVWDFFDMSSKYLRNDLARQAFMSDKACSGDGMEEQFRRALMEAGILAVVRKPSRGIPDEHAESPVLHSTMTNTSP
jgi:non-ribosomal peptide synthetase component F/thioredoxin reductase/carbonic anhydrase/acetyltransferase-like protein (isoleucine patch superfamily)